MEFKRQEHRTIAEALSLLDRDLFLDSQCWFAGGTAIVMLLGEYRLSLDVDFLCADADGYRRLRGAAVEKGLPAFFGPPVSPIREFRADQYGIRTVSMASRVASRSFAKRAFIWRARSMRG